MMFRKAEVRLNKTSVVDEIKQNDGHLEVMLRAVPDMGRCRTEIPSHRGANAPGPG